MLRSMRILSAAGVVGPFEKTKQNIRAVSKRIYEIAYR